MKDMIRMMRDQYNRRVIKNIDDRATLADIEATTYRTGPYVQEMESLRAKIEKDSEALRDLDHAIAMACTDNYVTNSYPVNS